MEGIRVQIGAEGEEDEKRCSLHARDAQAFSFEHKIQAAPLPRAVRMRRMRLPAYPLVPHVCHVPALYLAARCSRLIVATSHV